MFSVIVPAYNSEKYIVETLDSLVIQSYQNFEVIIVNDGSTDSTQDVIDKYCQKYSNFTYMSQKNQGVAIARNNAIKIAKGEYICFLDSDGDTYDISALKSFFDTIVKNTNGDKKPDLVIGRQTKTDPWSNYNYLNAKMLSNSKTIEPHNKWIIWTMSLLNKTFRREKILEIGLTMPDLSYASDGAFVLPFAYNSNKIVGCPHKIVNYKKRLFFDGFSISQTANMKTLSDYLEVHEIILKAFEEYSNKFREKYSDNKKKLMSFEDEYNIYLDALIHRQADILLTQFYRFFWRTDEKIIEKVKNIIMSFKGKMFLSSWEKLIKNHKDLYLNDLIVDKKEMAENPHVSIIIDENIKENSLDQILYNIHNFHFPSFEVLIESESFDSIQNSFQMEYIKTVQTSSKNNFKIEAIKKAKGKYLAYFDNKGLFSLDFLNQTFNIIYNSNFDFITTNVKMISDNDLEGNNFLDKSSISALIKDYKKHGTFSNKLIDIEFLKNNEINFGNIESDAEILYERGNFSNINKNLILTSDNRFKNPYISIIIDMDKSENSSSNDINDLFKSIYNQSFSLFDIFLKEDLKPKLNEKYMEKSNLYILNEENFKKRAIKSSKAKYALFVDIPVVFDSNTLMNLFLSIEDNSKDKLINDTKNLDSSIERVNKDKICPTFVSSPIYQFKHINSENRKEIRFFSSQELSYSQKEINNLSNKSKFIYLDLFLANKLINIQDLIENNIFFNDYVDVLNLYKNFKFLKVNQKLVLTKLVQNNLFKSSFKNNKVPLFILFFYKIHKLIFIILTIRRALKNGAK